MMRPFIYALVDPIEPKHVRYVGLALKNERRPYAHARRARMLSSGETHIMNWVRKLQQEGREYQVLSLETLPEGTPLKFLGFVESCYIKSLRAIGHRLTNSTDGGDGVANLASESRAKISAGMKGNTNALGIIRSAETRAKMGATKLGNKYAVGAFRSERTRAKTSATLTGHLVSEETREKIRQANLGYKHSEESRIKRSVSGKAAWVKRKAAKQCLS